KHSMPFCPSAVRAKNVSVVVNCAECEKSRLLFSARKLSKKDRTRLQSFLDTIFYTCGMSFHNTCDLAITTPVPSKQHDEIENLDEGDDCNEDEPENSDDENKSDNNMKDSIRELFLRVFVNDSWSCTSQIEKLYYSAGIYPD
ncbi:17660_t:CDS:1, partial [Rhizophagus irregularis]